MRVTTEKEAMHVIVTKYPDGSEHITQDGHGVLLDADVKPGDEPVTVGAECSFELVLDPRSTPDEELLLGRFSFVDYMDTATRGVPHPDGIRHTYEFQAPGHRDFGPYAVTLDQAAPTRDS